MDKEILELLKKMDTRLENLEYEVKATYAEQSILIKIVEENTRILRALEHKAEVNKAEHDKVANDIAHIKGNVEGIRKDLGFVEIATTKNLNDIANIKYSLKF